MVNVINGKTYPLWQQFVDKKNEWIGGKLVDNGDSMDILLGAKPMQTEIVDIVLSANGKDSAMFEVVGKEFTCSADVGYLGIGTSTDKGLQLYGYGDHSFKIYKPKLL